MNVQDARSTQHKDGYFDLLVSNNVFEHIYPSLLKGIVKEFDRITKKNGLQSHFIDMSDHFAHADKSITVYNYLKFSEKQWAWIDNSVQPQNRMRLHDYLKILKPFNSNISRNRERAGNEFELCKVKIDRGLWGDSVEGVAITHTHLTYTK